MQTWDEAAAAWLAGRQDSKWFAKDEGYVRRLKLLLGGHILAEIDNVRIVNLRDEIGAETVESTVNRYMGVVRSVLIYAKDRGHLAETPTVKRTTENERMRHLTPEQAQELVDALPGVLAPMAAFVLATGLRSANARELEWGEVSIDRGWASIPGSKMKNGAAFGFPLNADAITILEAQKGKHPRWVFPSGRKGNAGPLAAIDTKVWKRACKKAGIEDFHFHDLRHTWASWHAQKGTNPLVLQELGSWKDPKMVKRYAHLAAPHLAAAASNIGGLVCISPAATSPKGSKSPRSRPAA